jgi:transposase
MNEYLELIYQWHQGKSGREIRDSLGISRKTIRKYIRGLQQLEVSRDQPLASPDELVKLIRFLQDPAAFSQPALSKLEPYHEQIEKWLKEKHMTISQVYRLLREQQGFDVSYMSVYRYVRSRIEPPSPSVTVRLHSDAGQQAQVDFGSVGLMKDPQTGKLRKAWAFVLILSYSRHRFVRFVFRQDSPTWIDCHLRAFAYFQGCPKTILLDNLKSGVLKPDIYDPTINPAYSELERYFSFVADPAKVQMARHKGKVERQMPVVRQQLIAGREYRHIDEANDFALKWCRHQIGMRKHGTTQRKPFEVFQQEEADQLLELPAEPYERAEWKRCSVHRDCHLIFERSYYSVPHRYCQQEVWVRADQKLVRVYLDHQLIKTHLRAESAGTFRTDETDYPPEKRIFLEQTPDWCRRQASEMGENIEQYIKKVLGDHTMRNLRKAQSVLRLSDQWGIETLELACRRALLFGNYKIKSLRKILEEGLWRESGDTSTGKTGKVLYGRFTRPADYFVQRKEAL